jgi:uncharacterized protein
MTYLADVNFWLALSFESHVHHASARNWFELIAVPDECAFCRATELGFFRLATNPKAFADEAVTLAHSWQVYDTLIADPRVSFADEPPNVEAVWRSLTARKTFSPKVWNDAYLAAFAMESGHQLLSFDKGLRQYRDVKCTILS